MISTVEVVGHASSDDRRWFRRHRDRAYRLRPFLAGELPGVEWPVGNAGRLILVKQISPGFRFRLALWATHPICDCEECLAGTWEALAPQEMRRASLEVAAVCAGAKR